MQTRRRWDQPSKGEQQQQQASGQKPRELGAKKKQKASQCIPGLSYAEVTAEPTSVDQLTEDLTMKMKVVPAGQPQSDILAQAAAAAEVSDEQLLMELEGQVGTQNIEVDQGGLGTEELMQEKDPFEVVIIDASEHETQQEQSKHQQAAVDAKHGQKAVRGQEAITVDIQGIIEAAVAKSLQVPGVASARYPPRGGAWSGEETAHEDIVIRISRHFRSSSFFQVINQLAEEREVKAFTTAVGMAAELTNKSTNLVRNLAITRIMAAATFGGRGEVCIRYNMAWCSKRALEHEPVGTRPYPTTQKRWHACLLCHKLGMTLLHRVIECPLLKDNQSELYV